MIARLDLRSTVLARAIRDLGGYSGIHPHDNARISERETLCMQMTKKPVAMIEFE
ncbi:MAG: hypothetical protein ACI4QX_09135 [Lachnospiraceae bacterium]